MPRCRRSHRTPGAATNVTTRLVRKRDKTYSLELIA
jgi:hypothetical protein